MDEDEAFAFAVETTAQIEVLRHATAFLMARALIAMPPIAAETTLSDFENEMADWPPHPNPVGPAVTRFHEAVMARIPEQATQFADMMRAILKASRP